VTEPARGSARGLDIARTLRRIDERRDLGAFLFVNRDASGRGPVVAVKDNIVRGMPTTAGGRHLPSAPAERDAECVRRLRDAGCALIGKTNLYERRALATVDAILLPTVPFAPPLRARYPLELRRKLSAWTRPFNVSDSSVLSIPVPGTRLPVGVQIAANDDATAISVALRLERALSR